MRTVDDPTEPGGGPAVDVDARPEPRVLGRYRLRRRIGAGAFGVVWLADDEHLGRAVAIKRIPMHDRASAARAGREARAAARLSHPGIVALYEAGTDGDAVYLVSELVRGATLAELMEDGELSDRDTLDIGVLLCDALGHAHRRGVIHRDVKPANVIVCSRPGEDGASAKLTDFGIARTLGDEGLTEAGDVVGTLAYMAPEQAAGAQAGAPADLYALGLVLYEALSGVNPVRGRGAAATARRVGARMPALERLRRDLELDLCRAIDRTLLARPELRGTVAQLRDALAEARGDAGATRGAIAPPAPLLPAHSARSRRPVRPVVRLAAALAAAALAAAGLGWLGPAPALAPWSGAAVAGAAVALAPRLGWLALAGGLCAWLLGAGADGQAVAVAALALPTAGLLAGAGAVWSLPALAPLLGAAALSGAWPALAARAGGTWRRAALGALGCWWIAIAELLTGRDLALGPPPGAALDADGLWTLASSGVLALGALWAGAAVVLALVVRGRRLALDLVAAAAWAAGLGSATQLLAHTLSWRPSMHGLVAGAVVAGALAVASAAARADAYPRAAP